MKGTYNKKLVSDLLITGVDHPREGYVVLRAKETEHELPHISPGQFVEIKVDGSPSTFLRRPISINFADYDKNEIWLLIHAVGEGTKRLACLAEGSRINCVYPLGNGFTLPEGSHKRMLLIGGGVGTAPLLYHGMKLVEMGHEPTFLLGGRTKSDLMQLELFEKYGRTLTTTEDGSMGCKGFVTNHTVLKEEKFDMIATCGPSPMMKAVTRFAKETGTECEASLENLMACGLGACLCCVEKTTKGNTCVCKEGPVFNIKDLLW